MRVLIFKKGFPASFPYFLHIQHCAIVPTYKHLPRVTRLEPLSSGIGSDRSDNRATIIFQLLLADISRNELKN